jgi:hypothetical protein
MRSGMPRVVHHRQARRTLTTTYGDGVEVDTQGVG